MRIVHDEIELSLVGENAFAIERCWVLTRPATYDILRDRRPGLVACAGVGTALWDAIGKGLGQPLLRLWGGYRDALQMISIGGYYGAGDDGIRAEIADLRERRLGGLKFEVGGRSPEEDAARFRVARDAAGLDFLLAAADNQGWSHAEAIRFARLVEDCDLAWFEEPCRWGNDRRAMRDVRFAAGVRVCAGQSEYSAAGCRDLMAEGAIDVHIDASWSGGPTEWRRAAAIVFVYDVTMGHHEEPEVASHLLASVPHGLYVECFHPDRDPIWWNLAVNRPQLGDGWLESPHAPGLGWELDLEYVERHRVKT